jgi:hypothetical protein
MTLRVAARKHDIIPVVVSDRRENELPNVGLLRLRDEETGQTIVLDTSSQRSRQMYAKLCADRDNARDAMFRRFRLEPLHVQTGNDFGAVLQKYFHDREHRR